MWHIPRSIVNKILGHALRSVPEECVGVLSGQGDEMTDWHPLTNSLQSTRRFLANTTEHIQLAKTWREQGLHIKAIYHSHPTGPAEPSQLDIVQAHYPDALYLIVSLGTEGRLDLDGYLIRDGRVDRQELTIKD